MLTLTRLNHRWQQQTGTLLKVWASSGGGYVYIEIILWQLLLSRVIPWPMRDIKRRPCDNRNNDFFRTHYR